MILFLVLTALLIQASQFPDVRAANGPVSSESRSYYVDSHGGGDGFAGTSIAFPWKSLTRVNTQVRPGDTVLFKRGGVWRGRLLSQSGTVGRPTTYGAYGAGAKPLLMGSLPVNKPSDWAATGSNVWICGPNFTIAASQTNLGGPERWHLYVNKSEAVTENSTSSNSVTVRCHESNGTASSSIQLINEGLRVDAGTAYDLVIACAGSTNCMVSVVPAMKRDAPYQRYAPYFPLNVTKTWSTNRLHFVSTASDTNTRFTLYLGTYLPTNQTLAVQFVSLDTLRPDKSNTVFAVDVGNLILNKTNAGVKKWLASDLSKPGDFFYDSTSGQVLLYCRTNPAAAWSEIEAALTEIMIPQVGVSNVVYDSLALSCGGSFGFYGSGVTNITIRNCDVSWMGGGLQYWQKGRPVRYGNGIDLEGSMQNVQVLNCRVWEVYDAGISDQNPGSKPETVYGVVYSNNVVWNCEYAFEFWTRPASSTVSNVWWVNNTCANAGGGWGHAQRPDTNGCLFMSFANPALNTNIYVLRNIFSGATGSLARIVDSPDWTTALTMDSNVWWQVGGTALILKGRSWTPAQIQNYKAATGLDAHSVLADPQFLDEANDNFSLRKTSPALRLNAGAR
jgi:hypothetical protein